MPQSKRRALYAGTFDPFTNGHLDILKRALKLFDDVTIVVAKSPSKVPMIPEDVRVEMLKKLFKNNTRVKVDSWSGLIVDYATKNKISSIVRGLRPTGDFEIEFQMASMNRMLKAETDTVFLMTDENNYYVSSTLVREIFFHGGDVSPFVPRLILEEMEKIKKKGK